MRTLEEARKWEQERIIPEEKRPVFHLTPRIGWMNDPNGFSRYQGKYHLFYQYYPYNSFWSSMHWGHAVSTDLVHWEYLPCAMAPEDEYDQDGCFSGSSTTLPDGRQLLVYTGVRHIEGGPPGRDFYQTQCLAVGDGLNYEKYAGNPVISTEMIPDGGSLHDFRDPKIWQLDDGSYRLVVANRGSDKNGRILLYESADGFSWTFRKVLLENDGRFGRMWECPDFFRLEGKGVLLVSPQDMLPEGVEYHNGNGTVCFLGTLSEDGLDFHPEHHQAIDDGIDFYAPQTVLSPDGRRIMIGWMQNWDACAIRKPASPWAGQMSIPRELSIRDGRLYQWPVRELDALRAEKREFRDIEIEGEMSLPGISGRVLDMELVIRPGDAEKMYRRFSIRFAQGKDYYTSLRFRPHEFSLKLDRTFSGSRRAIVHQRSCFVDQGAEELRLRIILDRYSAEVFVNGGRQVMTATIYTEQEADGISFCCDGKAKLNLVQYNIRA